MSSLRPIITPLRCLTSTSYSICRSLLPLLNSSISSISSNTASPTQPPPRPPQQARALSTTPQPQRQTPSHRTVPQDLLPEYPYGPFRTYKQRNEGLFGRAKIRFGNTISERYDRKSRTTWLPNRHTKRLWSPALQAFIRTRMTASIMHTIDRLGGIDEYLLGSKQKRIKELGPAGWALRWKIMQTPAVKERFAKERAALGLPPKEVEVEVEVVGKEVGGLQQENKEAMYTVEGQKVDVQAVHDRVDEMIAKDEEFVLGPEEEISRAEAEAETETEIEVEAQAEAEFEAELAKVEAELAKVEDELAKVEDEIAKVEDELAKVKVELAKVEGEVQAA